MQLELNFSQTPTFDMQATMKDFCENFYGLLISMQIIAAPAK